MHYHIFPIFDTKNVILQNITATTWRWWNRKKPGRMRLTDNAVKDDFCKTTKKKKEEDRVARNY